MLSAVDAYPNVCAVDAVVSHVEKACTNFGNHADMVCIPKYSSHIDEEHVVETEKTCVCSAFPSNTRKEN